MPDVLPPRHLDTPFLKFVQVAGEDRIRLALQRLLATVGRASRRHSAIELRPNHQGVLKLDLVPKTPKAKRIQ